MRVSHPDQSHLQALIDEDSPGSIEQLLQHVNIADVASAWCAYHRREHPPDEEGNDDPDWWAVNLWLTRTWWNDTKRVRDGVLALIEASESEHNVLEVIGAGPLEALLSQDENTTRWVERNAAFSPDFRAALGAVWVDELPAEVAARFAEAAGVLLLPSQPRWRRGQTCPRCPLGQAA